MTTNSNEEDRACDRGWYCPYEDNDTCIAMECGRCLLDEGGPNLPDREDE